MPDPHAHAFARFSLPGVTVEETHTPSGRPRRVEDDACRLFLDASAGGSDALQMLQRLADALCREYGHPEWKGHRRWKGEAFQRFVAADVTCLEGVHPKNGATR